MSVSGKSLVFWVQENCQGGFHELRWGQGTYSGLCWALQGKKSGDCRWGEARRQWQWWGCRDRGRTGMAGWPHQSTIRSMRMSKGKGEMKLTLWGQAGFFGKTHWLQCLRMCRVWVLQISCKGITGYYSILHCPHVCWSLRGCPSPPLKGLMYAGLEGHMQSPALITQKGKWREE